MVATVAPLDEIVADTRSEFQRRMGEDFATQRSKPVTRIRLLDAADDCGIQHFNHGARSKSRNTRAG